jgi:magnesium transporter
MSEREQSETAEQPSPAEAFGVNPVLVRQVAAALEEEAGARAVEALVEPLHAADLADLISQLPRDLRHQLVETLDRRLDPEALIELDESVLSDVLERMAPKGIAAAVEELETDDAVYVLENVPEERREAVLAEIPAPDRAAVLEGLTYPEESAGRLMQRELVAVPAYWTVGQVIDYLRDKPELPDEFYEIYIVDPRHRPVGHVPLYRAMRAKRPVMMRDLVDEETRVIPLDMDQEEVARLFEQYRMTSAPVVDAGGRLVGVITFDDAIEVLSEESEEDMLRLAGVSGDADLHDPVLRTTRKRFTWLLVNLATAFLAAFVISLFDATIEAVVAVAILMPIVASLGGNAGLQAMTVTVRALATRELTAANALRTVGKETLVGFLNGAAFAVLVGAIAAVWFGDPPIGAVIAVAMVTNMLLAGLAGTLIPLTLQRLGADPAVAATVFLTTVTDVFGFFAFLGLATLVLL